MIHVPLKIDHLCSCMCVQQGEYLASNLYFIDDNEQA